MQEKLPLFPPCEKLIRAVLVFVVVLNLIVSYSYVDQFPKRFWKTNASTRSVQETEVKLLPCFIDRSKLRSRVTPGQRLDEVDKDPTILGRVQPGGIYAPPNCTAKQNVAIIVPYRDRAEHRVIFLRHMHSFLQKQHTQYRIYLIEPTASSQFNRGLLMNAGFSYASNVTNHSCYVFHDVDLLPINELNFYDCSGAMHLSSNNSKYGYRLPYSTYFGGVVMFTANQFRKMNGCSNLFFGWGQEDDDLQQRVVSSLSRLKRQPMNIGIYHSLPHVKAPGDNNHMIDRHHLKFSKRERQEIDGLNSLDVKTVAVEMRNLYTQVLIEADEAEIIGRYKDCYEAKKMNISSATCSEAGKAWSRTNNNPN